MIILRLLQSLYPPHLSNSLLSSASNLGEEELFNRDPIEKTDNTPTPTDLTPPPSPTKDSLRQKFTEKKIVLFNPWDQLVLIPTRQEYHNANLAIDLWNSSDELAKIKREVQIKIWDQIKTNKILQEEIRSKIKIEKPKPDELEKKVAAIGLKHIMNQESLNPPNTQQYLTGLIKFKNDFLKSLQQK